MICNTIDCYFALALLKIVKYLLLEMCNNWYEDCQQSAIFKMTAYFSIDGIL